MWGMPRTRTMPMIPATSTITSTALAQTSTVITRFHARREGENAVIHRGFLPSVHVQHHIDEHDEHEQHQRDAEQCLPLQAAGVAHFLGNGGGQ